MRSLVAILGRTNRPTCGVEDYCTFLAEALERRGLKLNTKRVRWAERRWIPALWALWRESADWRGWVVLQYTAGSWSRYGFPFGALAAMAILRHRRLLCAVMFHEPYRWDSLTPSLVRGFRGFCQDWVIRQLYRGATKAIFPDPLETIAWLPPSSEKAVFIPIGANLPEPAWNLGPLGRERDSAKTVAVFCLSEAPAMERELHDISCAIRFAAAKVPTLRLLFLGKGTQEAKQEIERVFSGDSIKIENLGLQSAEDLTRTLCACHALLCVRGQLFARRGSALAGVACGVPIVAYAGPAQQTPLVEAGIEFVPWRDREALGMAVVRVLEDESLQAALRKRSRHAQRRWFSWDQIAGWHVEALVDRSRL